MDPYMPVRGDDEGVVEQPPVQIDRLHGPRGLVSCEKTVARGKDKVSGIPVGDLAHAVCADLESGVHPAVAEEADAGAVAYPEPPLGVGVHRADEIVGESVVILVIYDIAAAVIPVQAADGPYPDVAVGVFCDAGDIGARQPGLARFGGGIYLAAEQ